MSGTPTLPNSERALARLSREELEIKRELVQIDLLSDTQFSDLEKLVNGHLKDIEAAACWLDREADTPEEKDHQFEERRKIIQALVDQVHLERGKEPRINLTVDLSELVQFQSQTSHSLGIDLSNFLTIKVSL